MYGKINYSPYSIRIQTFKPFRFWTKIDEKTKEEKLFKLVKTIDYYTSLN